MSTEPQGPLQREYPEPADLPIDSGGVVWMSRPRPKKFVHPYGRHLLFFGLTFFTTSFTVALHYMWEWLFGGFGVAVPGGPFALFTWSTFVSGLWYSVPLLIILSAHEFGHYFACRYHNVDATLPYYIPAPVPMTGTFGAVIRIKEPFPSKEALFDIGVAGPIAGFITLLPFLYFGIRMSDVTILTAQPGSIFLGEPLLWKALARWHFGVLQPGLDVTAHPMAFAAWWGMLATSLNLLPFGQLDGGHIMYASLGRRATLLSMLTLGGVVLLALRSPSWYFTGFLMVLMAVMFGFRHPPIFDEDRPLDGRRTAVALFALVMFVLCFTPVPMAMH